MTAVRGSGGVWRAVAPGRVNLIGEHTDYNDLPVLPMAIDRAIHLDFQVLDDPVVGLSSTLDEFAPFSFQLGDPVERASQGDWSNYVRAAAQGLMDHGVLLARGIRGTVEGTIPIASGLSSSSALVVASALALLTANGVELPLLELAKLMARAERYVGLAGGGMDQTVCLLGAEGKAVRIDFAPTRVTRVPVPAGWTWIVASSLTRAEKSAGAREAYNTRARECREALAAFVASRPDLDVLSYRSIIDGLGEERVVSWAESHLPRTLSRRFRHVVTEAGRVQQAEEALRRDALGDFGALMVESHASLRDDFEVSTPDLDEIGSIAMEAGAAGARLTGAGFGGAAIVLCARDRAAAVKEALAADFYGRRGSPASDDVLFVVRPSAGARVVVRNRTTPGSA